MFIGNVRMDTIAKTHAPLRAVTILHVVDTIIHRFESIVEWHLSRQTRKELKRLTDAQLDDVGLSRSDIAKF